MEKISKKTIKRIKQGYHDDLMTAIEFLIDSYNEDKFESGYRCGLEEMSVLSYLLAVELRANVNYSNRDETPDRLAKIIENFFENQLKHK